MNLKDIIDLEQLQQALDERGFNFQEVLEFIDDSIDRPTKEQVIEQVCDAYNDICEEGI